jgi:hypothetical protein
MKKTTSNKPASVNETVPAQVSGVTDPLPSEDAPSPPHGPVTTKLTRGNRPMHAQVELAPRAAAELRTSSSYAQQFGTSAPDPVSAADALTTACAWTDKVKSADDWRAYCAQQEQLAWKHAMLLVLPLRPPFAYAQGRGTALGATWPSLSAFFAVTSDRSKKAGAVRKRNKAGPKPKKAKPAATTASTPPVAEATPPPATPPADPPKPSSAS